MLQAGLLQQYTIVMWPFYVYVDISDVGYAKYVQVQLRTFNCYPDVV